MLLLEGDVVVGRSREVGALLLPRARRHELVAAAAAVAVAAAAEELDALGDDLDGLDACPSRPSLPTRASRAGRRSPTGRPFERYCVQLSAWLPKTETSK